MHAFLVTPGFESALTSEIAPILPHPTRWEVHPGLVLLELPSKALIDPVFSRQQLPELRSITGTSVRQLAEATLSATLDSLDDWNSPFSLHTSSLPMGDTGNLAHRAALIGEEFLQLLKQRRRRVLRRYVPWESVEKGTPYRLMQLLLVERNTLLLSLAEPRRLPSGDLDLAPWPAGITPIPMDKAAPSRAYQKLEEAFCWMGEAPRPGEHCVDLGGAPGGWAYTALKRGAFVLAVDRAPLSPPAAGHPQLETHIGNAFTYTPHRRADWLLCDVICEPRRTIDLLSRWLEHRWCSKLVCTIKFKGAGGYKVLEELPPLFKAARAQKLRVKQLFHNKHEVTVMAHCEAPIEVEHSAQTR